MELADRNLMGSLPGVPGQGLPGIPRDELLRYMRESGRGARPDEPASYQVQHLDIKPQNLFLIRKHVKVADFGLAKDLEGTHAALTSGITPIYAAPETFDGVVSRFCDQYSLAIVYQELLTGQRPFRGKNARQLLLQHVSQPPDLSALPEADRPAVARALAKNPKETLSQLPRLRPGVAAHGGAAQPDGPGRASCWIERSDSSLPPGSARPHTRGRSGRRAGAVARRPLRIARKSGVRSCRQTPGGRRKKNAPRRSTSPAGLAHAVARRRRPAVRCGSAASCGYCSHLDNRRRASAAVWQVLGEIPSWAWVLLGGIVCIFTAVLLVDRRIPLNTETRAVWGLGQLGAALVLVLAAQVWAVVLLAGEEGFDLKDVFLGSGRLWMQAAQRLPRMRWPIYLVSWARCWRCAAFAWAI